MTTGDVHILLVEGLGNQHSWLAALSKEWRVTAVHTGNGAMEQAAAISPQVIVFDASSLRSNGIRNCRRLHKQFPHIPLIHIRAATEDVEPADIADIFLAQPFTSRKLLNRIRAVLPANSAEEQIVRLGSLTLYLGKRSIDVNGRGEHLLTPKLARLLEEFMRHPNEVLSRKQLMEQVWQTSYVGDTRTLDVHVRWMREIIEAEPTKPTILSTVRGIGYVLEMPE